MIKKEKVLSDKKIDKELPVVKKEKLETFETKKVAELPIEVSLQPPIIEQNGHTYRQLTRDNGSTYLEEII